LSEQREKSSGLCVIPYVKGVSEKFKWIGNRYNIRTFFTIKNTLRISLLETRKEKDRQQMAQFIHSIPYGCGRNYTGETGRPLAVWLCDGS
jgi:hypothetical protein